MTFDEIYRKKYKTVVAYCYERTRHNQYLAEEAASRAFRVLFQKWDTLNSHEEPVLQSWLLRTAYYTVKEICRQQPPAHEPLDEPWCRDLADEMQSRNGNFYDLVTEKLQFECYVSQIEKALRPRARELFHYIVADGLSIRDAAEKMSITENALRIRWLRLQKELVPIVEKILNKV